MADKVVHFHEDLAVSDTANISREQPPRRWAMRAAGPGEIQAAADHENGCIRVRTTSREGPPENEEHAHTYARMVVGRLCQLGFPWQTALAHSDGPKYWPIEKQRKPEWVRQRAEFERCFDPGKADAVAYGTEGPLVSMQVTRVVIGNCFERWKHDKEYDGNHTVESVASAIWQAIARKTKRYRDDPAKTMLVLDPSAIIAVFDPRVLPIFFERWGDQEHLDRWACVWLGSLVPQDCKRLDGRGSCDGRSAILGIEPSE